MASKKKMSVFERLRHGNREQRKETIRLMGQEDPSLEVVHRDAAGIDVGAFRQCRDAHSSARFVFLTANPDVGLATQAFRLGAAGYVLKQAASDELVIALREALRGRTYITPRIANEVLQNLMAGGGESAVGLTSREREVLQLLAEGKTLKGAAAVLNVSPRTTEFHKNNIAEKTGLKTTAELARYAVREGLVSDQR
ncbi:MAG: response regulator transcription factor [Acidobacteria bacterium]|nr:response regulator transcription factor [Acidobacteriota bacterium]